MAESIHVMNRGELDGVNAFLLEKITKYSARLLGEVEGKDFRLEDYAGVADFCRHGMTDSYLKPVLDGVALSIAKFCNPEMTDEEFTNLKNLLAVPTEQGL